MVQQLATFVRRNVNLRLYNDWLFLRLFAILWGMAVLKLPCTLPLT